MVIPQVMGVAAITIVLTNYFTHSGWLFWGISLPMAATTEDEVMGCQEIEVVPVWQAKFPQLLSEGSTR